jgi:hypothetical protein
MNTIMTGETIEEIAGIAECSIDAAEKRVQKLGVHPLTRKAVYPEGTGKRVKDVKMGRPVKKISKKAIQKN